MSYRPALAALLLALSTRAFSQSELPKLEHFDASMLDRSKDACSDFYQYTCSKWISAHPIAPDMPSNSVILPLYLYNQTILRDAMEKAAADKHATGSQRQVGDFWQSCMDNAGRNAHAKEWLRPHLETIESLKSSDDLARMVAYLHQNFPSAWEGDDNSTKAALFGFGPTQDLADATKVVAGIDQGGMALPSLDYYLDDGDRFKELRAKYVQHVQAMFALAGDTPEQAAADAKTVLDMETALAHASMDNVTRRDPAKLYNRRTLAQLKFSAPSFGWDDYLKRMGAPPVPFYIVTAPGFLDAMEVSDPHALRGGLAYLFALVGDPPRRSLSGRPTGKSQFRVFRYEPFRNPGDAAAVAAVRSVGRSFAGRSTGPGVRQHRISAGEQRRANELVTQIRNALATEIKQLDWMGEQTKKQALIKQDATLQKIGYPDKWIDYSAVKIAANNYLANMNAANGFELHRQIAKIGRPVDRLAWDATPATIDAYENPQMNTINFPAGILQAPIFRRTGRCREPGRHRSGNRARSDPWLRRSGA